MGGIALSVFMQDITEQPHSIAELLKKSASIRKKADGISHRRVLFTGMGASLFACQPAVLLLRSRQLDAEFIELSELVWYEASHAMDYYDTVVFVSQSGESAELINLLERFPAFIEKSVLVTNNPRSKSALLIPEERVFEIFAGEERAMGASKTFLNTALLLLVLASEWSGEQIPLNTITECVEKGLKLEIDSLTKAIESSKLPIIVARGFSLGVAQMIRLMLAEIPKRNVEVFSGGAFRHGPLELLENDPMVIVMNPEGKTSHLMDKLADELSGKCPVVMLTNSASEYNPDIHVIRTGTGLTEELAPLTFLVPFQRVANELAQRAGYNPGEGVHAAKVTRVE